MLKGVLKCTCYKEWTGYNPPAPWLRRSYNSQKYQAHQEMQNSSQFNIVPLYHLRSDLTILARIDASIIYCVFEFANAICIPFFICAFWFTFVNPDSFSCLFYTMVLYLDPTDECLNTLLVSICSPSTVTYSCTISAELRRRCSTEEAEEAHSKRGQKEACSRLQRTNPKTPAT